MNLSRPFARILPLAFVALLGLGACTGSSPKEEDIVIEGSVEDLYNRATDLLEAENYKESARFYNEVERQHPYSSGRRRAQLMAAYAYYMERDYEDVDHRARALHPAAPGHRDVAYAYYLKALCYYEQIADVDARPGA